MRFIVMALLMAWCLFAQRTTGAATDESTSFRGFSQSTSVSMAFMSDVYPIGSTFNQTLQITVNGVAEDGDGTIELAGPVGGSINPSSVRLPNGGSTSVNVSFPNTAGVKTYTGTYGIKIAQNPPRWKTDRAEASATIFRISSMSVSSGATQKGVIGNKNWACPKGAIVYVDVALDPPIDELPMGSIEWGGDMLVQEQNISTRAFTYTPISRKEHLTAELRDSTSSDYLDLWVIWGSIDIHIRGNADQFPNAPDISVYADETKVLGPVSYLTADNFVNTSAKFLVVGKLTPPGIHDVVNGGWQLKRDKQMVAFYDEVLNDLGSSYSWVPDNSPPECLNLVPDNDDQIYDIDCPTASAGACDPETEEGYDIIEHIGNLREWLQWYDFNITGKTVFYWHTLLANNTVIKNSFEFGHIDSLPGNGDIVCGKVVSQGGGLAGVTVTAGGKTAVTTTDGSYRIKELAPGTYLCTAQKEGYTMSPAEGIPITVPVGGHVVDIHFTAALQ